MTERVVVVLAGAAARGAFQAGALTEIIPALHARGLAPTLFLGTSVGAINAAFCGSHAHLSAEESVARIENIWLAMDSASIHRHPLVSLALSTGPKALMSLFGSHTGAPALLDTSPLVRSGERFFNEEQLHNNIAEGCIEGVGVTATRMPSLTGARTGSNRIHQQPRTVLFIDAPTLPLHKADDRNRAVDIAQGPILREHVLASAAIPLGFPPVRISHPSNMAGWYVDGGVRLNAPLRPAVALGADRIVVIDATPNDPGEPLPPSPADEPMPPLAETAAMLMNAAMGSEVAEDIRILKTRNTLLAQAAQATGEVRHSDGTLMHPVPHMLISPQPGALSDLADEIIKHKTRTPWRAANNSVGLAIDRILRLMGNSPGRQDLLSYIYFDTDYFTEQINLGRQAARAALAEGWQV